MTAIELFNHITSQPKWYAGYTSAQHAYLLKKRFKARTLEFATLERLFNHFGYYLDAEWVKVENKLVALENRHLGIVSTEYPNK